MITQLKDIKESLTHIRLDLAEMETQKEEILDLIDIIRDISSRLYDDVTSGIDSYSGIEIPDDIN